MKDNYAIFMKNSYQISEIILKNIFGCISENEKIQLQEWMNRNPENKQKYADWMKQLSEEIHADESIDVQQAWNKVQKRIQKPKNTSIPFLIRISAAVVCLLILSGVSYYLLNQPEDTPIVPGCEQAILTDEKGNEIAITPENDVNQSSHHIAQSYRTGNSFSRPTRMEFCVTMKLKSVHLRKFPWNSIIH